MWDVVSLLSILGDFEENGRRIDPRRPPPFVLEPGEFAVGSSSRSLRLFGEKSENELDEEGEGGCEVWYRYSLVKRSGGKEERGINNEAESCV